MSQQFRKTKITSTLGPATTGKIWTFDLLKSSDNAQNVKDAYDRLEGIFKAGTTVVRFNFSHGSMEEQEVRIEMVRTASKKLGIPISLLLDTKGPEIRIADMGKEGQTIEKGTNVTISALENKTGTSNSFSVTDSTGTYNMANDVKVKSKILVDDGKLFLEVTAVDVKKGIISAVALNSHLVKTNKRINLPGASYSMDFVSEKDKKDIILAAKYGFAYVAASFVNNASNVNEIRKILKDNGGADVQLISKIESTEGIENLDAIIQVSDGIMVARGDLGIEIPFETVPYWEKYMVDECRKAGKLVIVATQMLDSMERNLLPTRAEVTDVFYSVNIGADSSMTSGETAAGLFPVNSIQTMNKINVESEQTFDYEGAIELFKKNVKLAGNAYGKAVIEIAKKCVPSVKKGVAAYPYEFISVFTNEDILIKALSTIRPAAAIIVVTDDEKAYTKYGALYGVKTYLVDDLASAEESAAETLSKAINNYASVMGDGTINNKNVPTILTSGTKEITVKTIKIN